MRVYAGADCTPLVAAGIRTHFSLFALRLRRRRVAPFDGSDTSKQRGSARPCANEVVGGTAAVKYCQVKGHLISCMHVIAIEPQKLANTYRLIALGHS